MRRLITLHDGIEAAEEIASQLLGFSVRKAIDPLTPAGFILIGETVAERLAKATEGAELEVIADVLETLDLDWQELSEDAIEAAMKAVQKAIADTYIARVVPTVSSVLIEEGTKFMRLVRLATIASQNFTITPSLSQRDLKAEEQIRNSHLNYIRDAAGVRSEMLSRRARELVTRGVSQGLGTDTIGKELGEQLSEDIPRPDSYWRTVADAFVGRGRAASQIGALEDAEIDTYEIVAVLDEVTTDICRFMDGKVFQVSAARGVLDSIEDLDDPEDVKYAQPWVRVGKDGDGGKRLYVPRSDGSTETIAKIERSGVGAKDDRGTYSSAKSDADLVSLGIPVPPFHGRCRTTIVAGSE